MDIEGQVNIGHDDFTVHDPSFVGTSWSVDGAQSVDLNDLNAGGAISQIAIPTKTGFYQLSFYVSSNIFCNHGLQGYSDALTLEIDDIAIDVYDAPTNPIWLSFKKSG